MRDANARSGPWPWTGLELRGDRHWELLDVVTTDLGSKVVEQMRCRFYLSRMHSIPI